MYPSKVMLMPGFFVLVAFLLLVLPLPWVIAMILGAAIHELGHIAALRILRIPVYQMRIRCTGAYLETGIMTPVQEIFCAASGPIAGLMMLLLGPILPKTAFVCLVHSLFNLLPVYPFDGGRILRGIICKIFGEHQTVAVQKWIRWGSGIVLIFLVLLFLPMVGAAGIAVVVLLIVRTVADRQTN